MDLQFALLEVGKDELKDSPTMDGLDDLAQRIRSQANSKWIRANFKYVVQDPEFIAFQEKAKARGLEVDKKSPNKMSGYLTKTPRFWQAYVRFILALSQAFRVTKLPVLNAKSLAEIENSSLLLINNHIAFHLGVVEDIHPPSHMDMTTMAEDLLEYVRRHCDEDEQEGEIGWDPRGLSKYLSPRLPTHYLPAIPSTFSTPVAPLAAPATTAQDLLNGIMGFNGQWGRQASNWESPELMSIAPQPKPLFGSELCHRSIHLVDSVAAETPLVPMLAAYLPEFTASVLGCPLSIPGSLSAVYTDVIVPQPIAEIAAEPCHCAVVNALRTATADDASLIQRQQHHPMPSSSVAAQLFPNHRQVQHDPFAYSSPI
ncbi:hypothetical protein BDZ97DRAFT_1980807 [Flammula alnicola]|nr:hypothetical protein BDZ97DRAFT_1980807 [Flammula alnicola]